MKKLIGLFILIIVLIFAGLLYWLGFFDKVVVTEMEQGPYILVYENHQGDYRNINFAIDTVYYRLLNEEQIQTTQGFGVYYDNPKLVAKEDLRSIGGVILDPMYENQVGDLERRFNIKKISAQPAVVVEFPYKNKLSIIAGVYRVYPVIQKYLTEKNYPTKEMMEIYDSANHKITYLMFLD